MEIESDKLVRSGGEIDGSRVLLKVLVEGERSPERGALPTPSLLEKVRRDHVGISSELSHHSTLIPRSLKVLKVLLVETCQCVERRDVVPRYLIMLHTRLAPDVRQTYRQEQEISGEWLCTMHMQTNRWASSSGVRLTSGFPLPVPLSSFSLSRSSTRVKAARTLKRTDRVAAP